MALLGRLGFLLAIHGFVATPAQAESLVDRIVAVVNGQPILHSEVQEKLAAGLTVTVSAYPAKEQDPPYRQALEDEINMELVLQKSNEIGVSIPDDQVERQIIDGLQSRGLSREALMRELERSNYSYEAYKENYRRQMIFRQFQGMVIRPSVKITDRDVESYYLRKSGSSAESVTIGLSQILIKVPSGANSDLEKGKEKLIKDVRKKLDSGMTFEQAVRVYSDDELSKGKGGDMGEVRVSDLAPLIQDAIKSLEVNQYTQPIRTPLGFHIFLMRSKKFAGSEEYLRLKKGLEQELILAENEKQTRRWLEDQRKRSEVTIIR